MSNSEDDSHDSQSHALLLAAELRNAAASGQSEVRPTLFSYCPYLVLNRIFCAQDIAKVLQRILDELQWTPALERSEVSGLLNFLHSLVCPSTFPILTIPDRGDARSRTS